MELFVLLGITASLFVQDPERYKVPLVAYLATATVRRREVASLPLFLCGSRSWVATLCLPSNPSL